MPTNTLGYSSSFTSTSLVQRKVAIPRLQRSDQGQSTLKDKRRVPRACTACRSHKIKCTGGRPQCKHCATTDRECVYIMPRKDRLKIIAEQCQRMAELLHGLKNRASEEDKATIEDILGAAKEYTSSIWPAAAPSNPNTDKHNSQESRDLDAMALDEELNTESLDLLDEDLHEYESVRATRFVGRSSEVQWLWAVAVAQAERADKEAGRVVPQRRESCALGSEQISTFSFWTDSENVDVDYFVDPYELPQPETAERLLSCYMAKAHDSFPILPRKVFEHQFQEYYTRLQNGNAPRLSPKWQAILNMVFAIGAKYSHLIKASWRADERDHLIYQVRARVFGLNESVVTNHSDMPQIQILGLLAFYWLSIGQVSRAWTIVGMAIRLAHSLGLHVRKEDPSATATRRERLVRTWWSLSLLERTLSIMTGRPSIIVDSCCSVLLPIPVPEEQLSDQMETAYRMRKGSATLISSSPTCSISPTSSIEPPQTPAGVGLTEANSGSYFKAVVQLSIITQNILTSLYSVRTVTRSPREIQQDIAQLGYRLDQWASSLPAKFNVQILSGGSDLMFARERMLLSFQLCSARMLLTHPYLSGRRTGREGNETSFARHMAKSCIEAAKTIMDLLPDEPSPLFIYDQGPWWCIVHYMMRAISVFLLGLSYASPMSQDSLVLVRYVKKAVLWLRSMQDPLAQRAYHVALSSFEGVAKRQSLDISDLWMEDAMTLLSRGAQRTGSNAGLNGRIWTQFVPIPPVSAMSTFAPYNPVSISSPFPPHTGAQVFDASSPR